MTDHLFSKFKQQAITDSYSFEQSELEIDLLGMFPHCARSPDRNQKIASPYIHAQLASGANGICFIYEKTDFLSSLEFVGSNASTVLDKVGLDLQIALVDAIFEHINKQKNITPSKFIELTGKLSEKAIGRAFYIASAVKAEKRDNIGVIGCVEPIIRFLSETGANIRIADKHSVYQEICGYKVERDALPIINWASKLVLTGSALWTQTMGDILDMASERSIFTVVFAMTGHNIAPHYLDHGATVVISEHFPFYWFANTISKLDFYSR